MERKIDGLDSWEIKDWIGQLESMPINVVKSADLSAPYEMTKASILELENGKYALVTEMGCSCYSSSDADIELFPTLEAATEQFEKWVKENSGRAY